MDNGRPFILVVDDDPEIRRLVAAFLAREGLEVDTVEDAAAMDAAMARRRPDLVVLDLMMPGEDGLSVCRRLRATGGPAILMLTAKSDVIDRVVGLELGADD
ncbi:MAG: response regulator, partial [Pseudomonadota bacterium]